MENKITFLGPFGTTFSHEAYNYLASIFRAPQVNQENYINSLKNEDILANILIGDANWGSIAMETSTSGRIQSCLELFMSLLNNNTSNLDLPLNVVGGFKMDVPFSLMINRSGNLNEVRKIVGHKQALDACHTEIKEKGWDIVEVESNGQAALEIYKNPLYKNYVCLAPKRAAEVLGLRIIEEVFNKEEKQTTFFLLSSTTPSWEKQALHTYKAETCRVLLIFKAKNEAGSLYNVLSFFKDCNIIQIHSMHSNESRDIIALEIEAKMTEFSNLFDSLRNFSKNFNNFLKFGPFPFYSKWYHS